MASQDGVLNSIESITLPTIALAAQATAAATGTIGVSGATLIFYNGSTWKSLSEAN